MGFNPLTAAVRTCTFNFGLKTTQTRPEVMDPESSAATRGDADETRSIASPSRPLRAGLLPPVSLFFPDTQAVYFSITRV